MILTFEIFGRARNHGEKFLKLCQTSFSGIVHFCHVRNKITCFVFAICFVVSAQAKILYLRIRAPGAKNRRQSTYSDPDIRVSVTSQSIPTGYIPPGNPRGLAQKYCPGGRDLTSESCPGAGNLTRAGILWKFKVKHFVRVLVLSVVNTGCPKNC